MTKVKVNIVNKSGQPLPAYATLLSAGMDLRACLDAPITLGPLERTLVPTGLFIALPAGFEAQVRPRRDYRGEIKVILVNLSNTPFEIVPGERIAQMVVARHERVEWEEVDSLDETERGAGGFGSTGR